MSSLPEHPEIGWSWRRHNLYRTCPRKLWWATYGMWGGWSAPPGSPSWEAYRIGKLTSLSMMIGTLAHDAMRSIAEAVIEGRSPPEFEVLWEPAWRRLVAVRNTSREQFLAAPKHHPMLADVFFDTKRPDEITDEMHAAGDLLLRCIEVGADLPIWDQVASAASVRRPDVRERLQVSLLGNPEPVALWGAPDLAMIPKEPRTADLVDWKTSEVLDVENGARQVHVYAAVLIAGGARWDDTWRDRWRGRLVNLRDGTEHIVPLTAEGVDAAYEMIEADVRLWRRLQTTRVPNVAAPDAYPKCADRRICSWCEYVPVCKAYDPDERIESAVTTHETEACMPDITTIEIGRRTALAGALDAIRSYRILTEFVRDTARSVGHPELTRTATGEIGKADELLRGLSGLAGELSGEDEPELFATVMG